MISILDPRIKFCLRIRGKNLSSSHCEFEIPPSRESTTGRLARACGRIRWVFPSRTGLWSNTVGALGVKARSRMYFVGALCVFASPPPPRRRRKPEGLAATPRSLSPVRLRRRKPVRRRACGVTQFGGPSTCASPQARKGLLRRPVRWDCGRIRIVSSLPVLRASGIRSQAFGVKARSRRV